MMPLLTRPLLAALCCATAATASAPARGAPTTTYRYGEETVTIPDLSQVDYVTAADVAASACSAVENHTAYLGHDIVSFTSNPPVACVFQAAFFSL